MYEPLRKSDGQHGAGYHYQYYAAAFVASKLLRETRKDKDQRSTSLPAFVTGHLGDGPISIRFEGLDEDHEDFELIGRLKSRRRRLLFQVKTRSDETEPFTVSSPPIASAIERFLEKDGPDIAAFVLLTNVGIRNASPFSQALPVPFSKTFARTQQEELRKQLRQSYEDEEIDALLSKLFFWSLPAIYHLVDLLAGAFGGAGLSLEKVFHEIAENSRVLGGTEVPLETFEAQIQCANPVVDVEYQLHVNERFLAAYLPRQQLPRTSLADYVSGGCYVVRSFDEAADTSFGVVHGSIDATVLKVVNPLLKRLISAQNKLHDTLPDKALAETHDVYERLEIALSAIQQEASYFVRPGQLMSQLREAWNQLNSHVHRCHPTARAFVTEAIHALRVLAELSIDGRNVLLLLGTAGAGKTLAAYRFARRFSWFYLVNAGTLDLSHGDPMEEVAKQLHEGLGVAALRQHLAFLKRTRGDGVVVLDAVEQSSGFTSEALMVFLERLSAMQLHGTVFVVTCRSDCLDISAGADGASQYAAWTARLHQLARSLDVPTIGGNRPVVWLNQMASNHGVDISTLPMSCFALSRRFTPRMLNFLFLGLKRHQADKGHATHALVIADMLRIYHRYVVRDCHVRTPELGSLEELETCLEEIADAFLRARATQKGGISLGTLRKKLGRDGLRRVLDDLVGRQGEIEQVRRVGVEWRISEQPYFCAAEGAIRDLSPEMIEPDLRSLLKSLKRLAGGLLSDVLVYFVHALLRRAHDDGTDIQPRLIAAAKLAGVEIEASIACQIATIQSGRPVKNRLSIKPEMLGNVSFESYVEYMEAYAAACRQNPEHAPAWKVAGMIELCDIASEAYDRIDYYQLESQVHGFIIEQLVPVRRFTTDALPIVKALGERRDGLDRVNAALAGWVCDTTRDLSVAELDEILALVGSMPRNQYLQRVSRALAGYLIQQRSECLAWINSDALIYQTQYFYPRRDVVNAFVDCLAYSIEEMQQTLVSLRSGGHEHRRNWIFITHRYYKHEPEVAFRRFEEFCGVEEDLSLLSTVAGIVFNEKDARRREVTRRAHQCWTNIARIFAARNVSLRMTQVLGETANNDELCRFIIRHRGLVECQNDIQQLIEARIMRQGRQRQISRSTHQAIQELIKDDPNMASTQCLLREFTGS